MKSIFLHHMTKPLLAAIFYGTASLLSPLVAHSAEERSIAPGTTEKLALSDAESKAAGKAASQASAMEIRWQQLQQTIQPKILIGLSTDFARDFPNSRYARANAKILAGAQKAHLAQEEAGITSEALEEPTGNRAYRNELIQAMRGSKDSAYRVAAMYRKGTNGLPKDRHRAKQWLRVAAELGMGKASWEVANIYNRDGEMADAAKFEARAVKDGFRIPPRLPTRNLY